LEHWLPGGKHNGTEYTVLNPTRSDNHAGSFSVNMRSGQWGDFATDDKGGDLVSLVCYLERCANHSEAARLLSEFLGIDMDKPRLKVVSKTEWQPIIPVPEDAEPPPERHPKLGEPAARWTYHDAEGRVLCHVCRFNTTDSGKEFRPLTYRAANGTHAWRWEGLPDPRPLFNLHLLARHPSAAAIVCEGEKSAEAAAQLFPLPQYVTLTSLNGAKGVRKADWKPLEGRTLYLWPDNDKPGLEYVTVVAERLKSSCVPCMRCRCRMAWGKDGTRPTP
jgi:putative DNA primase/helicase